MISAIDRHFALYIDVNDWFLSDGADDSTAPLLDEESPASSPERPPDRPENAYLVASMVTYAEESSPLQPVQHRVLLPGQILQPGAVACVTCHRFVVQIVLQSRVKRQATFVRGWVGRSDYDHPGFLHMRWTKLPALRWMTILQRWHHRIIEGPAEVPCWWRRGAGVSLYDVNRRCVVGMSQTRWPVHLPALSAEIGDLALRSETSGLAERWRHQGWQIPGFGLERLHTTSQQDRPCLVNAPDHCRLVISLVPAAELSKLDVGSMALYEHLGCLPAAQCW